MDITEYHDMVYGVLDRLGIEYDRETFGEVTLDCVGAVVKEVGPGRDADGHREVLTREVNLVDGYDGLVRF